MNTAVASEQRHKRRRPCPICQGGDDDRRGREKRCHGWTSDDGEWAHCSREERAGSLDQATSGTYAHRLFGPCRCGETHNPARSGVVVSAPEFEALYDYRDERSNLLFQVVRKPGKQFLQRRPDGDRWIWKTSDVRKVLYRLPELIAADKAKPVHIVEGEKDVHALERVGLLATTNPGGAGKWRFVSDDARTVLAGRDVIVIADADEPGREHAKAVVDSLATVAKSVRLVEPPTPYKDVSDAIAAGVAVGDLLAVAQESPSTAPRTPADRVRALVGLGPVLRLDTGIPTLDASCRGGLPTRRLVVIGGAPGAGKTTLATNLAWRWAKAGIAVGILAVDEGPEGTIARIAQLEGIAPEKVEERDASTLERLAKKLDGSSLILLDGEDAAGSVEGVAELVAKRAAGGLGVLVVDSIQTVSASGTDVAPSPRERVDAVVRALKSVRDKHGLLILATCELARGAYRSRSVAETINDLAAFKESGAVEYAAQTALVLRSVPDEPNLVDVTVPKNRAYKRDPFRLRLDHVTTELAEVELPEVATPGGTDRMRFDSIRRSVVDVVGEGNLFSVRGIIRATKEAGHHFRTADVLDAVQTMQGEGVLAREGKGPFRIVIAGPEEGGADG